MPKLSPKERPAPKMPALPKVKRGKLSPASAAKIRMKANAILGE